MFVQIHMLQSLPPGNLNRDENGQPKKCTFGGVTRGRISSQCLKRTIRRSPPFQEAFGDHLGVRTKLLPSLVRKQLEALEFSEEEIQALTRLLKAQFKKKEKKEENASQDEEDSDDAPQSTKSAKAKSSDEDDKTPQLVFIPPRFAEEIAEIIHKFKREHADVYENLIKPDEKKADEKEPAPKKVNKKKAGKKNAAKDEKTKAMETHLLNPIHEASKTITPDIGLFGRMTTSDIVWNVDAACQVAHAFTTHEVWIESDYFTAMDDLNQDGPSAAFLGSGDNQTFFNSGVFYKYFNVDVDALTQHLTSASDDKNPGQQAALAAQTLLEAAARHNPSGKQNAFAAHGLPELILVEISKTKQPISYANAFLEPVEGGPGRNLMTASAEAFYAYVESIGAAFAPSDMQRVLLAVGHAKADDKQTSKMTMQKCDTLVELVREVGKALAGAKQGEIPA